MDFEKMTETRRKFEIESEGFRDGFRNFEYKTGFGKYQQTYDKGFETGKSCRTGRKEPVNYQG